MKKILPILSIVAASALIVGCSTDMTTKKETFINNLNAFKQDVNDYAQLNESKLTKTALNKYKLSIESNNLQNLNDITNSNMSSAEIIEQGTENNTSLEENEEIQPSIDENLNEIAHESYEETQESLNNEEDYQDEENNSAEEEFDTTAENLNIIEKTDNTTQSQISTLYSLSSDIEDSCDEFCELKEDITNAIVETQNLIQKIQNKELELTREQRMFITEQSTQLKSLGRQLSNITTELSLNLSDLNQIMATNGQDIDNLSLKYLVVLDNLVNGNEMLQSGLSSLNLINQMFNMRSGSVPNNHGRILYGFKNNDNPPVIKDYFIDENGELVENKQEDSSYTQETENSETQQENENKTENTTNIDTYKNSLLASNIDTYNHSNTPRNIDSFFNTALLDNEFMYGNNYGYGGINGMYPMNPYMNGYANYERANTNYSVNNNQNNQNIENNQKNENTKKSNKEKKRIELKKNIDTYKDENEPHIKVKLNNIKNSITGFFGKFKKADLEDKINNPVYRYDTNDEASNNS